MVHTQSAGAFMTDTRRRYNIR